MVFSAPVFLFGFLPITLLLYFASPRALKNPVLLVASLLFYAWGEVFYVGIMLASIFSNFIFGKLISQAITGAIGSENSGSASPKMLLAAGIAINIALLMSFKYANFIADNFNSLLAVLNLDPITLSPVHLPLGISFFTFQAISYIVDVYRKEATAQNNILNLALYISLFPQLIAGPIVRYHDVASQILARRHSLDLFASGTQRFIFGLAKKMLIANPMGQVADSVFALPGQDLTMPLAWIGILAYTLQIYFDFSGYSDMAIGLGRMFGFRFLENFEHPYIAKSIREFWRRWHISLSTWFRDYVYIPLGGSRVSTPRVYLNLLLVFLLTGIWHGASWNFVVWGLFHGFFLASEHMGFSKLLSRSGQALQHIYVLLIVIIGWVFFRAENLTQALGYLGTMFHVGAWHTSAFQYAQILSQEAVFVFILGVVLSLPVYSRLKTVVGKISSNNPVKIASFIAVPKFALLCSLLALSVLKVATSTYNPFIYFRF